MDGLIHIYCGDGKGKTSAAVGLGVRACGSGKRVLLVQFLKGENSAERSVLAGLPRFTVAPNPEQIKFTFQMTPGEREEAERDCRARFTAAVNAARAGECDLLILDEALGAVQTGLLPNATLADFMRNKPSGLELVLTGRDPSPEVLALADYVSEIRKVRHPFDRGVPARRGIEF